MPLPCDVRQVQQHKQLVRDTVQAFGKLNFLINNAGQFAGGAVGAADLESWDAVMEVNLRGPMHLTHHAIAALEASGQGAVINIASISSKLTHAGGAVYCASKHALLGFSNALFEDVREKRIKVTAICPGYVATDMASDAGLDMERAIQPEDVADTVAWVLASPTTVCPTEIVLLPQRSPYREK